jgi:hypothetical protein
MTTQPIVFRLPKLHPDNMFIEGEVHSVELTVEGDTSTTSVTTGTRIDHVLQSTFSDFSGSYFIRQIPVGSPFFCFCGDLIIPSNGRHEEFWYQRARSNVMEYFQFRSSNSRVRINRKAVIMPMNLEEGFMLVP